MPEDEGFAEPQVRAPSSLGEFLNHHKSFPVIMGENNMVHPDALRTKGSCHRTHFSAQAVLPRLAWAPEQMEPSESSTGHEPRQSYMITWGQCLGSFHPSCFYP